MQTEPTPQFINTIAAAVEHWRQRTETLDDAAMARLDEERQNLYRAVEFGLKRPETWKAAAIVALQAFDLVERRGYWREWMPMLEAAVTQCGDAQKSLKCRLLNRLGVLYRLDRQLDVAVFMHQEAETLVRTLDDQQALAETLYYLGGDYLEKREHNRAEHYGLAALEIFNGLQNVEHWLAWNYKLLGQTARDHGETTQAAAWLAEAATCWRALNRPVPLARTLVELANTLWPASRVSEAEACFTEATTLLASTFYELDKTVTYLNLGTLYYHIEQWDKAESAFRQADSTFLRQSGHVVYQAHVANNLGSVLLKRGRPREAEGYLRRALALWRQPDDNVPRANTLGTLAQALVAQERMAAALDLYDQASKILRYYSDDTWARWLLGKFVLERQALVDENKG